VSAEPLGRIERVAGDRWERFAQEDAEFYVYSRKDIDFSTPEGQKEFWASGVRISEAILREVGPHIHRLETALEIGAGIGRIAIPMARTFAHVVAIDISPTMVIKLQEHARDFQITNIEALLSGEPWESRGSFDLVYSKRVFRHIVDWAVISDYIERIALSLSPDGVAWLEFDSRPPSMAYAVRNLVPDALLPRTQKRGIRGVRRPRSELLSLFERSALLLMEEFRPGTKDQVFVLVTRPAGDAAKRRRGSKQPSSRPPSTTG
jgi:2-polyprenyl-3-methyl-5-hydroxy-6-metoxy-1,4-benzoquinol methylase